MIIGFRRCHDDLDVEVGGSEDCRLLGHACTTSGEYHVTVGQHDVAVEILADLHIALYRGLYSLSTKNKRRMTTPLQYNGISVGVLAGAFLLTEAGVFQLYTEQYTSRPSAVRQYSYNLWLRRRLA